VLVTPGPAASCGALMLFSWLLLLLLVVVLQGLLLLLLNRLKVLQRARWDVRGLCGMYVSTAWRGTVHSSTGELL
jgi:hypothetical protein